LLIGGKLGYGLLRWISSGHGYGDTAVDSYDGRRKLESLFGTDIWSQFRGRTVIDFGCGRGEIAVEMARQGAAKVIGVDIRPSMLRAGDELAAQARVIDRCGFTADPQERADVIVCIDSCEHFSDPAAVLLRMGELLKLDGRMLISFGPTWYHPYGGHLFSVFPWAHLLFTEPALIRWRSDFKTDGATCFGEVEGGLNQMTIARFERLVRESPFEFENFEAVPIRAASRLHNHLTREFFTAIVRCRLRRKP
jgi:SAM-dependent methyltransferase